MGLDTVDLIFSFERYFEHEMPDPVAETLSTVRDVAQWYSQQLGLVEQPSVIRHMVQDQVLAALAVPTAVGEAVDALLLIQMLPDDNTVLTFQQRLLADSGLNMSLLSPPVPRPVTLLSRLFGRDPNMLWEGQTIGKLVDWLVSTNYKTLLVPPLSNRYEVERAVIGITSESSGVSVEEVKLESRFTYDLGMD